MPNPTPISARLPLFLVSPLLCLQFSCSSTPTNTTMGTSVALHNGTSGLAFTGRRPDGREIALSNRTKWAIQPAGASATLRWQPGEPLRISNTGNPMWPAAITSLPEGNTALARPAGTF